MKNHLPCGLVTTHFRKQWKLKFKIAQTTHSWVWYLLPHLLWAVSNYKTWKGALQEPNCHAGGAH
jgi:hypothetical protein